jgi:PAS domain S-box-containing protein
MSIQPPTQDASRESEEKYRMLFNNASDAIVLVRLDENGNYRIVDVNDVTCQLLGFSHSEMLAIDPRDLIVDGLVNPFQRLRVMHTLTEKGKLLINHFTITKGGNRLYVENGLHFFKHGNDQYILSIMRDLSDRRKTEEQQHRSANRSAALYAMGQAVLSTLEPHDVMDKVLDEFWPLIPGVQMAAILVLEKNDLVYAAMRGPRTEIIKQQHISADSKGFSQVLKSGKSTCLLDFTLDAHGRVVNSQTHVLNRRRSLLAVPLRVQERIVGIMMAICQGSGENNEDDLNLMESASGWAAIAIANANQHQMVTRRLEESQALLYISQALNETFNLDRIFTLIVEAAARLIPNAGGAIIHRLEEATNTLHAVAVSGITAARVPTSAIPVGQGIAGQALRSHQVINVRDMQNDPRSLPALESDLRSLLVAPIQSGDANLGTISVRSTVPEAFDRGDEQLMHVLATQAALAIRNARLYQEERQNRQTAEGLARATEALNQKLDRDDVLDRAVTQVSGVIPCAAINIMLIQGDDAVIIRQWVNPANPHLQSDETMRLPLSLPTFSQMLQTAQPLLIADTTKNDLWKPFAATSWIRSYLGTPMIVGGQALGFLQANSNVPDNFTPGMVPIMQSYAAHTAIAIQNARLVNDLQEALKQEKTMRARLIQADRLAAMGRMSAAIAHEINNPLQAILGCVELAMMSSDGNSRRDEYLPVAKSELLRLIEIVQRILSFQRPSTQTHPSSVDMEAVINDVLALAHKRMQHANVTVRVEWTPGLPEIEGVTNQLKQVFLNLTLNAVDAMPKGGRITIRGYQLPDDDTHILIDVADNGVGMTRTDLDHLFEPFFSTKLSGTGLGLWVTHNIITNHHGSISVQSRPGEGATFTLKLLTKQPEGATIDS